MPEHVGHVAARERLILDHDDPDGTDGQIADSAPSVIRVHNAPIMQRLLAAALLSLTSAAPAAQSKSPEIAALEASIAGREQQPAEQVFKNIRTFKGMPAIRVLRIMEQAFVPNLGVTCSHCHVEKEWESDAKPAKGIARNMWTLRAEWQDEVRKASGNNEAVVTCYTCHKGQPKPAFAPGR
jgi:hypothetical protein